MAIWKAVVEWGSLPHGDGSGDPTQPNLGDGCANFDPTWQGSAAGVGGMNDNVMSAISSCGGGVVAFTEGPTSDGWRIRFCDDQVWDDGPGASIVGFDIQGVATREYGRVHGLGNSSVPNATMSAMVSPIDARSIEADDIAGLQFQYGVKSPAKPTISSVSVSAGVVTVLGTNFDPANNSLWLPQPGGGGNPLVISGLTSTAGGTQIQTPIPPTTGPGDILVRLVGASGDRLSNAFPFAPFGPPPVFYCAGKLNSLGCVPFLSTTGAASGSSTTPFRIQGHDTIPNEFGLLIYGSGRLNLNFHNGKLCVKAPLTRVLPPKNSGSTGGPPCSGVLTINFQQAHPKRRRPGPRSRAHPERPVDLPRSGRRRVQRRPDERRRVRDLALRSQRPACRSRLRRRAA